MARTWIFALIGAAALLGLGGAAMAAPAQAGFGPKVGGPAPKIEALADQDGKLRKVSDLAGPKGVVVMFFRSAGWCPFCQAQLMAMNDSAADLAKRGYTLVGLSYEPPAVSKTFADRRKITYPLLFDEGSKTIDRWGLRDPQYPAGHRAAGVPRPIIFVLDRKGRIQASLAEETYRQRPPAALVLTTIDDLR